MRRLVAVSLLSVAAVMAVVPEAEAQLRRRGEDTIILNVRPRSYLDAGRVVAPHSQDNPATSGYAQTQSYLNLPPYVGMKDRFGEGVLPDPVTNGPFPGARNAIGPVDYETPFWLR